MKLVFYEIEEWEKPILEHAFPQDQLTFYSEPLTLENIDTARDAEYLSVFIYSQVTEELLQQLPMVKLITTRSTGFDHIDLLFCQKQGIVVSNVPEYGTSTVAEHTFALLLAISRKLLPSVEQAKKGDFSLDGLRGFDLAGKTLGIVGFGAIGQAVSRIAHGFGMNVLVYTHHPDNHLVQTFQITFVTLEHLLSAADIVTLHLPYTEKTHHIINQENIVQFKKGSVLLNTARGGLVETEAILIGLEKELLQAVGTDVLEGECMIKEERQLLTTEFLKECDIKTQLLNHVILTKENVIVTPHNAFNSDEALKRILDVTIENIVSCHRKQPKNEIRPI